MNNALISPNELVYDQNNNLIGERIAEVATITFPVAEPLYWVSCADEVNANDWYWNTTDNTCELRPIPPELTINPYDAKLAMIIAERNNRLSASDWTQMADVIASHNDAWLSSWNVYRQALRDLPLSITPDNIDNVNWPIPPSA